MSKNYNTLHDFVMDAHFCEWVYGGNPEADMYWRAWIEAHPEKTALVRKARLLVLNLKTERNSLSKNDKALIWAKIQERKHIAETPAADASPESNPFLKSWGGAIRVAASLAAVVLFGAVVFLAKPWKRQELVHHTTQYGELKNITLPDGSTVVLNSNSDLSYKSNWSGEEVREVRLKGEAFFSISHKGNAQKFKVRLTDETDVEVLGTKFTATNRPLKTRVILNEGKVKFTVKEEAILGWSYGITAEAMLKPGEMVEVGNKPEILHKVKVLNPEGYAAFRFNKLMFTDAPLSEVARVLGDNYGYDVIFSDAETGNRRFTGTVQLDEVELLFTALEKLFSLKIIKQGKQIRIV